MEISTQSAKVKVETFKIDEEHSNCKVTIRIPKAVLENDSQPKQVASNKNKILIQCLDKSGSMSGTPINSLKDGALLIGENVLTNSPPFE